MFSINQFQFIKVYAISVVIKNFVSPFLGFIFIFSVFYVFSLTLYISLIFLRTFIVVYL
jgi:hypothetical protein